MLDRLKLQKEEFELLKKQFKEEKIELDLNKQMEAIDYNRDNQIDFGRVLSNDEFFTRNNSPSRMLKSINNNDDYNGGDD